jgi:hypothetical protein
MLRHGSRGDHRRVEWGCPPRSENAMRSRRIGRREALGMMGAVPRYLLTLHGLGYKFVG